MGTYSRNTGGGSGAFQGHRLRGRPAGGSAAQRRDGRAQTQRDGAGAGRGEAAAAGGRRQEHCHRAARRAATRGEGGAAGSALIAAGRDRRHASALRGAGAAAATERSLSVPSRSGLGSQPGPGSARCRAAPQRASGAAEALAVPRCPKWRRRRRGLASPRGASPPGCRAGGSWPPFWLSPSGFRGLGEGSRLFGEVGVCVGAAGRREPWRGVQGGQNVCGAEGSVVSKRLAFLR